VAFAEKHFINEAEFLRRKDVRAKVQVVALVINQFER
jgi:hypothetical protein